MSDKKVTNLNKTDFDRTIKEGVTLVDFWASWCAPCRMQVPILEDLAESIDGQAKITKVNVDEARTVAEKLGVQAIPTLILFKVGKEIQRFIGVQSKETLIDAISSAL